MKRRSFETFVKWHDRYQYATESFKMVFSRDVDTDECKVRCFDVDKSGIGLTEIINKAISKFEFEWAKKQPPEDLAIMLRG